MHDAAVGACVVPEPQWRHPSFLPEFTAERGRGSGSQERAYQGAPLWSSAFNTTACVIDEASVLVCLCSRARQQQLRCKAAGSLPRLDTVLCMPVYAAEPYCEAAVCHARAAGQEQVSVAVLPSQCHTLRLMQH